VAVKEWDPTPYPEPRKDRGAIATVDEDTGLPPIRVPRVYLWAFFINEQTAAERVTVASRAIRGPALIKDFTGDLLFQWDGITALPQFQMYWSATAAAEGASQALLPKPTGTSIFEWDFATDSGGPNTGGQEGIALGASAARVMPLRFPFNYPVNEAEFFLNVSLVSRSAAAASQARGVIRVYEGIDPRDVASFM